jgi:hypothetical protein
VEGSHAGIREVTLRSMMGDFGGNAGLLSAWFNFDEGEWKYEIQMCRAGVQHVWWAVHVVDLATIGAIVAYILLSAMPASKQKSKSALSAKREEGVVKSREGEKTEVLLRERKVIPDATTKEKAATARQRIKSPKDRPKR